MTPGLYRPEDARDDCGFVFIAPTLGEASLRLLRSAIDPLAGIAADGKTGDGCGLLSSSVAQLYVPSSWKGGRPRRKVLATPNIEELLQVVIHFFKFRFRARGV